MKTIRPTFASISLGIKILTTWNGLCTTTGNLDVLWSASARPLRWLKFFGFHVRPLELSRREDVKDSWTWDELYIFPSCCPFPAYLNCNPKEALGAMLAWCVSPMHGWIVHTFLCHQQTQWLFLFFMYSFWLSFRQMRIRIPASGKY